jgi:uncharacterized membrane protein HdeD (DUF308 family)
MGTHVYEKYAATVFRVETFYKVIVMMSILILQKETAQTIFFILFFCFSGIVSILHELRDEKTSISYSAHTNFCF